MYSNSIKDPDNMNMSEVISALDSNHYISTALKNKLETRLQYLRENSTMTFSELFKTVKNNKIPSKHKPVEDFPSMISTMHTNGANNSTSTIYSEKKKYFFVFFKPVLDCVGFWIKSQLLIGLVS